MFPVPAAFPFSLSPTLFSHFNSALLCIPDCLALSLLTAPRRLLLKYTLLGGVSERKAVALTPRSRFLGRAGDIFRLHCP